MTAMVAWQPKVTWNRLTGPDLLRMCPSPYSRFCQAAPHCELPLASAVASLTLGRCQQQREI